MLSSVNPLKDRCKVHQKLLMFLQLKVENTLKEVREKQSLRTSLPVSNNLLVSAHFLRLNR